MMTTGYLINQTATAKRPIAKSMASQKPLWIIFLLVVVLLDLFATGVRFRLALQSRRNHLSYAYLTELFDEQRLSNPLIVDETSQQDERSQTTTLRQLILELMHEIFALLVIPLWLLIFGITGLYSRRNLLSGYP